LQVIRHEPAIIIRVRRYAHNSGGIPAGGEDADEGEIA